MTEEREENAEQQIDSTFLSDSVRAAPHFQLEPNQIVDGRFKVLNEIGRGGMGIVYRVEQMALGRELALKTISGENISDITWRRFQQEAKAASLLDHPNLITVHDCGLLEDRHPYFVMDLVDGVTLSDLIKQKGPLQVEEALPLFIQVCFGLAYAHDLGIIHRDIKPSNIILVIPHEGSTAFNVKIVDFGIAKLATHETSDTQGLTKTGEIFGSPLYMSPEQCLGTGVDVRSDIYSVGCVLFEALTGLPPFLGNTALSTMMKHQSDSPPTLKEATLGKEFPASLEQIVAKLLEKDPAQRYQTLKAVARDLSLLQQGISAPTIRVGERKSTVTSENQVSVVKTVGLCLLSAGISAVIACALMEHYSAESRKQEEAASARAEAKAELIQLAPRVMPYENRSINDKSQFSSIRPGRHGTVIRHFSFKQWIGNIKWSSINGPIAAKGEIDVPLRDDVRLLIEDIAVVQSEHLFSRFNREDLDELVLSKNAAVNDATLTDIGCLKSLRVLELSHCLVSDAIIDKLNQLPVLKSLDISWTKITADGVSRLLRLRHLSALSLNEFKNSRKLLESLRGSPNLAVLSLQNSEVKNEDLELISSFSNLGTLNLCSNPGINDKGIAHLRGNNSITCLFISETGCTSKVIETLATMPKLDYLGISKGVLSKADEAHLMQKSPKLQICQIDDDASWKRKLKADFMDVIEGDKPSSRSRFLDLR